MKVAIYDTGIGGLQVLMTCSLFGPEAEFIYIADREAIWAESREGAFLEERIEAAAKGPVDVVVPVASVTWPALPDFSASGRKLVDPVAAIAQRALIPAAPIGLLAPTPVLESPGLCRKLAGGRGWVGSNSDVLARAIERGAFRDQYDVDAIRAAVGVLCDSGVTEIVPCDSHAGLMLDLIARSHGDRLAVVDVPGLLGRATITQMNAVGEPKLPQPGDARDITVVTAHENVEHVYEMAVRVLQVPRDGIDVREMPSPGPLRPQPVDIVLLAYSAFNRGSLAGVRQYLAPGAWHAPSGRPLSGWLDTARAAHRNAEFVVEHVFRADGILGVVGTVRNGSQSDEFVHHLRYGPQGIERFEALDQRP